MRKLALFIAVVLTFCLLSAPVSAQGLEQRLFRVATAEDLLRLAENCRLDSYSVGLLVTLTNDIDLSGIDFPGIPTFSGIFDGRGHTVSNFKLQAEGSVQGLFRYLTPTALVEDLHVRGIVTPTGSAATVGGIAGQNAGTLRNCSFNGIVSGADSIGGIAGSNTLTGIIDGCVSMGTVHGSHFVGGIAGQNAGVLRGCENTAQINTTLDQNQIRLEDITLDALTSTESVAAVTDIGGICGASAGVIRKCVNRAAVGYPKIGYNVGGITGSCTGYIVDCTNEGDVRGRKDVGGIAGQLEPAVSMLFEEDALQTLEGQMQTMSGIANTTASHAQNAASDVKNQIGKLDQEISNVQDALSSLLPDSDNPQLPDSDSIQAAQNVLAGSMSIISGILNSAGSSLESSANILSQDISALSGQMNAISQTLNEAKESLGGSAQDVSDLDTDEDTTAKLLDCANYASVSGDWNVGGIVGTMGLENDLDPESDLALTGNLSANFDLSFRAVVHSCQNQGTVSGSKQHIGGIAGWASMGLLKACTGRGSVAASAAEYAGGIAGLSKGYIRDCLVRCAVEAGSYTGGIAGSGVTVTDCRSVVRLTAGEKSGTVLGFAEDMEAVSGNIYLVIDRDNGAIDGISYAGSAYPLEAESFFALPELPSDFDCVTVTFRFEDGSFQTVTLPYGFTVNPVLIPDIPEKGSCESQWEGDHLLTEPMYFDAEFTAAYTSHTTVLSSDLLSAEGHPRMLAQGDFTPNQTLSLTIVQDDSALYAWNVSLPESGSKITLRLLPPEELSGKELCLQICSDGRWQDVSCTQDGRYLVFSPGSDIQALRLLEVHRDYTLHIVAGAAIFCAIIAITVIVILCKPRKRTP